MVKSMGFENKQILVPGHVLPYVSCVTIHVTYSCWRQFYNL